MLCSIVVLWLTVCTCHSIVLPAADKHSRIEALIKDIFDIPDVIDNRTHIACSGRCVPLEFECYHKSINGLYDEFFDIRISTGLRYCQDNLERCCSDIEYEEKPPEQVCGSNLQLITNSRISGDETTEYGEFPWMVAVLLKSANTSKSVYKCGGSLIHTKVVLTVAHCVDTVKLDRLKIRVGQWNLADSTEPHQDRAIARVIFHPAYNNSRFSLHNDIALLILRRAVRLSDNVNTVCLPAVAGAIFNRKRCSVTGWGKDRLGKSGQYQNILKKVDVPIVPRLQCQRTLQRTRLGRRFQLHSSFICAGGELGRDACTGDGGSPLVCPLDGSTNRYQQVGIVALGIGCGNIVPGIYVNVAHFKHWIDGELQHRNLLQQQFQHVE